MKLKIIFLVFVSLFYANVYGQTNIFTYTNSTPTIPTGFVLTNNVLTNAVDQSTYLLVDAGSTSDFIVTPNYDLSTSAIVTINANVATFGAGTVSPLKIEFSTNGGSTWSTTSYSTATPASTTYITGGPIYINQIFTSTTKFRFSNPGTTGRGVRIQNLILDASTSITSAQNGSWIVASNWVGGIVPTSTQNVIIAHNITVGNITRDALSTTTINTNANLAVSAVYTNNGATTVNGTFQIDQGGFGGGSGTYIYGGASTLTFNHTTGVYGLIDAGHVYWPSANSPFNVTISNLGSGGINLGVARTVVGTLSTSANIQNPGNLTINGTLLLNSGYNLSGTGNPIYGSSSLLRYNSGGSPGRNIEWIASSGTIGSTPGFPNNVQVSNNTSLNYPNGSTTTRGLNGNLTIDNGSGFFMDFSAGSAALEIGKNLTIGGSMSLGTNTGGDLYVNGNLTNNGTFSHKTRAVYFSGTSLQTITGSFNTAGATNNLPFVFINNSNNVALASPVLISNNLTFSLGKFILGTFHLTLASGSTISSPTASNYVQTSSTGRLIRNVGAVNVFYPVGNFTYNPITLNNTGGTPDDYGLYVIDNVTTPVSNDTTKMVNRFWNINETIIGGNNLAITTQWNSPTEENVNFATATIPRIGIYDTSWTTQTATAIAPGTIIGSATFASNINFTPANITGGATIGTGKDDAFTFPPPTIASFSPTSAYTGGTIVITGTNFLSTTNVTIGGVPVTSFVINSLTQISAVVAAGASGSVVVTSGTGSGSLAGFTYLGYISNADGSWSVGATWLGGVMPPNNSFITINNAVNLVGSNPTQTSITVNSTRSLNINSIGSLIVTNSITNNGTVNFSSTGTITSLTFNNANIGTLSWSSGTSTLFISNGGLLTNSGTFTRGTGNINFSGSGTISGTINFNNLTVNGSLDIGISTTINGNLTLNASSFINSGIPAYANTATLIYNSGSTYNRGNEWAGTFSGQGFPNNIQTSSGTTFNMNLGTAFCGGNITIDAATTFNTASVALNVTGNVIINGTMNLGGDVTVKGNWTVAATGVQNNSGKAVTFNVAAGNQTIAKTGGGTVFFDYLIIDKTAGNVVLSSTPATDVTINPTLGDVLQLNNSGALDLNGRTLTLNNDNGSIAVNGTNRFITSTLANASIIINGNKFVTGIGNLVLATNVNLFLNKGFNCGAGNKTTINGTLQINLGGFVDTNAPVYGNVSLLKYNSNTVYNRGIEWNRNIGALFGLPNNVQISNNTTLNYPSGVPGALGMTGNLIIDAGSSMFMDYGNVSAAGALTINGNLTTAGNLTLGFALGDDLRIAGNLVFNTGYTFDAKNRAIFFTKNSTQTISGTGGTPTFHYVLQTPASGINTIQLSGIDLIIAAPNTGNSIDFGTAANVFDINGRTLTLGTIGVNNTITGSLGSFKGSISSNLTLRGNNSIGTLNFTTGFQNLDILNLTRTNTTIGAILGTNLSINSLVQLNSGLLELGINNLTLSATALIGGTPSPNNFIIANNTGELRKTFTANGSFTFPIGDNTGIIEYSPATLNFTAGSYLSAYAGLRVTDAKHPNNIATTDFLTRFWSVTSSGITSPVYSFTGTYLSGTADVSGTETNNKPGRWDGTDWIDESVTSISSNTLSLIGLTTLPTINQFTAGTPLSDANYYYRSNINNGLWNSAASWQASADGINNWISATTPPSEKALGIFIRNGFNINADVTRTADDLIIETGANLTISSGTFTLNNGAAATDLLVNGTLTYNGGTFTQNAGSGIVFAANSIYNHSVASATLTLPIATWNITSNCNVTGMNNGGPVTGSNMGQSFGNFTWNNALQGSFVNIENSAFTVVGALTVGPTTNIENKLSFGNAVGTFNNVVNTIVITGGQLNGVGNLATVNLTVTNGINISGGIMAVSDGSGIANITVGTDLNLSGNGYLYLQNKSTSPSQTLNITRDFIISGTGYLNMETVTATGTATINVGRDFTCTATFNPTIDFGTGTATGNVINISRNFTKSGTGQFQTTSTTSATGFAFVGNGTFNYSGNNSSWTSYIIQNSATLQLNSNLTLGINTNPPSIFTVANGGTLNFGTNSIIAENTTDPRFITTSGSTLSTSNTGGLGGTTASGSVQSFSTVNSTTAAGRATFATGTNYTFNGATITPFPNGIFGNPATINVNAVITSNMVTNLSVTTAINISNGASFTLNSTNNNSLNLNGASLNINTGGIFDNGGENQVINGSPTPAINISGTFITRDVQGFVSTNTAIPTIFPVLNPGSTVEYGFAGNQLVQGSTVLNNQNYQNVTFSNGGTKTLVNTNAVAGTIAVLGTTIFDSGNFDFGSGTSTINMTGTSKYMLGGTTSVKPDSGGAAYNLGANTTFEFTGTSATNIRLSSPSINYRNIIISGINVSHTGIVTGLKFATGGTFTVKNGAVFKIKNTTGFTGSTTTGIDTVTNGGPAITLETGSRVEFAGNQILPSTQTVTPFATYSDVGISGTGTKTIANTTEILVGRDLVLSPETISANTGILQIDNNRLLTVTGNILNTSTKELTIKNGGNLVQITEVDNNTGNLNTGNIKMTRTSRSMLHNDYVYWGAPVKGNVFSQIPTNYNVSYMWNLNCPSGSQEGFWDYTSVTEPGRGFITRVASNGTGAQDFNFTGISNNGTVKVPACNYDLSSMVTGNTILLGNPYPSAIDGVKFLTDPANLGKIGGTLYFWTSSTPFSYSNNYYVTADYSSWNLVGGVGTGYAPVSNPGAVSLIPAGKIAAGQGFFAQVFNNFDVTFKNYMRERTTTSNSQFFKASNVLTVIEQNRIWLNIYNNNNGFRQTLIGYVTGATNDFERMYDGDVFSNNTINIYSVLNEKSLVIQGRALPFVDTDIVPLGYKANESGIYNIAIDQTDGLFAGDQNIYLEDLDLNIIHDIKAGVYSFSSEIGTFDNRFVLRYINTTLSAPNFNLDDSVLVYKEKNALKIISTIQNIENVSVYDMLGRTIFEAFDINDKNFLKENLILNQQTLIVKIKLLNGLIINKKIIY